eukprot:gene26494-17579_t
MSGRKKKQATAKGVGDGEACDTSSVSKKQQPSIAKFFKSTSTAEEEDSTYVHSSYSHVRDHLAVPSTSNDDGSRRIRYEGGGAISRALRRGGGGGGFKNQGVTRLLADFGEKSRNGEWPSSTNVSCYWCCHKFIGVPFGLPTKMNMEADRKFHVIGCFCSLECACAYNFASRDNTDERLARYTLINNMATRMGFTQVPVKAAPDRLALDMFGGHMQIEDFRSTTDKHVIVNTTPMLSIVQQAEELNEQDMHSEYRYISLDKNRVCKFQEKIKLKRSKPLIGSNKVTLDQSMKLTFNNA